MYLHDELHECIQKFCKHDCANCPFYTDECVLWLSELWIKATEEGIARYSATVREIDLHTELWDNKEKKVIRFDPYSTSNGEL